MSDDKYADVQDEIRLDNPRNPINELKDELTKIEMALMTAEHSVKLESYRITLYYPLTHTLKTLYATYLYKETIAGMEKVVETGAEYVKALKARRTQLKEHIPQMRELKRKMLAQEASAEEVAARGSAA